jgi:hypothetical protein
MKTIMHVSIKGCKKDLDQTLKRLLRDRRIKIIFVAWESESTNNVGIGDHAEGDLL